jgi:hypothetical protein
MIEVPTPEPPAGSDWAFNRIVGGYETANDRLGITMTADEIERKSGELRALLTVRSTMVGLRTVEDNILKSTQLNFYADRSRNEFAKSLRARCPGDAAELDWEGYLERFTQQVIAAERRGDPAISLRDYVPPETSGSFFLPEIFSGEEVTIWFGDGGSMKSYLMLAACATLDRGDASVLGLTPAKKVRVGIVDWEYNPAAHKRRLMRLCPDDMPDIIYIRAERALVHEVDRLRRIAREENIGALCYDSIIGACDGPPESAQVANEFFRAARQVGVPALANAHRTKAEDGDQKPFGSAFWHNLARLTWFIKKSQETNEVVNVAMFNRKNNDGPDFNSKGFSVHFDRAGMRTVITPSMVIDDPVLSEGLPMKERIAQEIRFGPRTMAEIAASADIPLNTVVQTVKRGEGRMFTRVAGPDGVYRIALLAPESAPATLPDESAPAAHRSRACRRLRSRPRHRARSGPEGWRVTRPRARGSSDRAASDRGSGCTDRHPP